MNYNFNKKEKISNNIVYLIKNYIVDYLKI